MIYLLTMRDGSKKELSTLEVGRRLQDAGFTRLGANFESRLAQLKFIEPDVIDWEMIDPFSVQGNLPLGGKEI